MTFEIVKDNAVLETVRATVQKHGAKREELIPILNEVNRKDRLPPVCGPRRSGALTSGVKKPGFLGCHFLSNAFDGRNRPARGCFLRERTLSRRRGPESLGAAERRAAPGSRPDQHR